MTRPQLLDSAICGCFSCLETFPFAEITQWTDFNEEGEGQTAICPRCGIDAVDGFSADDPNIQEYLADRNKRWFGGKVIRTQTLG